MLEAWEGLTRLGLPWSGSAPVMSWWSVLLFLGLAALLWRRGLAHRDDVIGLFTKSLAGLVVLVVVVAGQPLLLELGLLALALWLPSALQCERQSGGGLGS